MAAETLDELDDWDTGGFGVKPGEQARSWRFRSMPARFYHCQLGRQSSSQLKPMLISPAHFMTQFTRQRSASPAMAFGSLVHLLVLEPVQLPLQYVVVPGNERPKGAELREVQQRCPGLEVITEIELHEARMAAERVMDREVMGRPFGDYVREGEPEVTFFYDDPTTGTPCRTRLDLWHPQAVFDLKTTRHATVPAFANSAIDMHYDLQAYMYCLADACIHGLSEARPFIFMSVESSRPHAVHVLRAGESFLANGRAKYERAIALVAACSATDHWPDNSTQDQLEIAPWQAFSREQTACA